ncbi:MAG: ATP-binding cassette domain-containing protein [Desulfobacteraceae bacterium]|nr:MAG: ATP-binding cassette domain-containing protein [Desulfobacteraceae bacterium]
MKHSTSSGEDRKKKPFITLHHVSLRAPAGIVFEDTNWGIHSGEQWAVLGPNGSGKSDLLKGLLGKVPVVSGSIVYHFPDGESLDSESVSPGRIREMVACVSQEYGKAPPVQGSGFYQARWSSFSDDDPLQVSEYILRQPPDPLGLVRRRFTPDQLLARAEEFSAILRLEDLWNKKLIALSDGELRRVMIAEALVKGPVVLILENPFAGLDDENKTRLRDTIPKAVAEGTTLILVTARADEVIDSVTHVLLVNDHRVIAKGPKDEILRGFSSETSLKSARPEVHGKRLAAAAESDREIVLQFTDVNVSYDGNPILDGVDWEVRKGEHWALLGPNGAGKTTLLSLILGDNPQAYANRISLFGRPRGSGETIWEIKARVGWVSPELHLYYPRRFSCFDVVCSGFFDSIGLHRRASDDQRRSAESLLEDMGIEDLGEKGFNAVSYGEQRLVLLARALVKRPPLLVLDEPCQGVDGPHRDRFLELVNELGNRGDTTIIFVTHVREELPWVLTHALLLRRGRVFRKGPIDEVLSR